MQREPQPGGGGGGGRGVAQKPVCRFVLRCSGAAATVVGVSVFDVTRKPGHARPVEARTPPLLPYSSEYVCTTALWIPTCAG